MHGTGGPKTDVKCVDQVTAAATVPCAGGHTTSCDSGYCVDFCERAVALVVNNTGPYGCRETGPLLPLLFTRCVDQLDDDGRPIEESCAETRQRRCLPDPSVPLVYSCQQGAAVIPLRRAVKVTANCTY